MLPFTALFVLVLLSLPAACQSPDVWSRYEALRSANSLDRSDLQPWHLHATFQLFDFKGKPSETGTLEVWSNPAKGLRRVVVTSPSWTSSPEKPGPWNRTAFLVDSLVTQLATPLPRHSDHTLVALSDSDIHVGKAPFHCFAESSPAKNQPALPPPATLYCTEPDQPVLRVVAGQANFRVVRNHLGKFQGVNVATETTISFIGQQAISGKVDALSTFDLANGPLLAETEGMAQIDQNVASGMKIAGDTPTYPVLARMGHIQGSVVSTAIINASGDLEHLDLVASSSDLLTASTLDAVRKWKYKPYLLDGKPTDVHTMIVTNYDLR